ncbi:unnamed protein product [Cylindrotheca closterium]|uniref:Uncharacterized protein n=1 Tax=Cylindrotheca closterium TaxID=2856 RepID=A0AAD2FPV4_9STRA|nr:unnamed protein product [Cylindrotheca closterium]
MLLSSSRTANTVLRYRYFLRYRSSQASSGQKLSPLPSSSPAQAKQQYLKSKQATDRYLDPQQQILQMNREMELVRNKHATKLEKELKKSIYRRLVDPLVKHKHSIYNVFAMTIAYVLAHNLYVTSKKEKECRSELLQNQEENTELKQIIDSLLDETILKDISSACAMEIEKEFAKGGTSSLSSWLAGGFSSAKSLEEGLVRDIVAKVLRHKLLVRIGSGEVAEEEDSKLSVEEIMQQNQESMKVINASPELLLKDALQQASSDQENGKESRRVFSL